MFCAASNGGMINALLLLSLHVIAVSVSPSISDNTWSVGYNSQRGRCGKPFVDNGQSRLKNRGRVLRYKCRPGYQLYGERANTCVGQHWILPHSICAKAGCAAAPAISNGSVSVGLLGALRTYSCDAGYTLQGHAVMYCNGRHWNGTAPFCRAAASHSRSPAWCDFEDAAICGWTHDLSAHFQWTRHSGSTPSSDMNTGPATDHTLGLQGHYMYMESSAPRVENDTARLFSAVYTAEQTRDSCFQYWFHMYGLTQGELRIYFLPTSQSMDGLNPARRIFGNRGNQWNRDVIPVPSMTSSFQIVIEGVQGSGFAGDCAIDDVSLLHGDACIAPAAALPPLITQSAGHDVSGSCLNRCDDEEDLDHPCSCTVYCQLDNTCCRDHVSLCTARRPGTASSGVLHQLENTTQTVSPHSADVKPPDLRSMETSRRIDHSNGDRDPSTTSAPVELNAAGRSSSRQALIAGELPPDPGEHGADQQAQIDQQSHSAISVAISGASTAATDANSTLPVAVMSAATGANSTLPVAVMSAATGANSTLPLAASSAATDATESTTSASTTAYRSRTSAEDTYSAFTGTPSTSSSDSVVRLTSVELITPATLSRITPVELITPSTSNRFTSDSTLLSSTTPAIWHDILTRSKPLIPYPSSDAVSHTAMPESSTAETDFIATNKPEVQLSSTDAGVDTTAATFSRNTEGVPIPTDDTLSNDIHQYIKQSTSGSQNNSLNVQDRDLYPDYRTVSSVEARVSKAVSGESAVALNEEDKMWPGARQSSGRGSGATALAAGTAVAVVAVLAVSALVMFLLRARRRRADQLEDCDSLMFFADSDQDGSMDMRVRIGSSFTPARLAPRTPSTPARPAPRTPSATARPGILTSDCRESEPIHDVDLEAIDFDESETARLTFS